MLGGDVVKQADEVRAQLDDGVGVDHLGLRRPAVTPLIGRQDVETGLGQSWDLVSPRIRQFGESVGQDDERRTAFAGFGHPKLHPVRVNQPLGRREHGHSQAQGDRPAKGSNLSLCSKNRRFLTAHAQFRRGSHLTTVGNLSSLV